MRNLSKSRILYYLCLFIIAVFPFFISRYFFSVNDLPKNSALIIFGSVLLSLFVIIFSYRLIRAKESPASVYLVPKLDFPIIIFLIACIISAIFSLNPSTSFWGSYERQLGLITFIYLTVLYFISGYLIREGSRIKTVLLVIEIVSVIISVYAILQFFKIELLSTQSANSRPGSFLGNSVFLGGFLVLILPFSAMNAAEKKNKLSVFAFPILIFTGIVASGTRSAYIALIIQVIIYFVLKYKHLKVTYKNKKQLIFVFIPLLILSIVTFLFYVNQGMLYQRVADIFRFHNPRFILWGDAFDIFFKYPITGPGIAMYAAAFEEFYSNALRFSDALVVYDNAHNNYLHILFTMGLIGFLAYAYLIYSAFRSAIKISKHVNQSGRNKNLSYSFIMMLSGYCVYGLTNFDDISILFYLFIMLSVLRASMQEIKEFRLSKFIVYVFSFGVIIFCIINTRHTINSLTADIYFNEANMLYDKGEFVKALDKNNKAIDLNPGCSAYRFVEAAQVYNYCFENSGMYNVQKQKLLVQVEAEINKAKENLYYINYCNGLLSLVYFEEGREEEAEKLKNEVLEKDSININYRIKLTRYLLRENRLDEVKRNLNILLLIRPKEAVSNLLAAMYYNKLGDGEKAVFYSNKVLVVDENNKLALDIINQYKGKK